MAKGRSVNVLQSTREMAQPAVERTRHELRSWDRSTRTYVRGHPVLSLLVALSAGYAFGRLLRGRSRHR